MRTSITSGLVSAVVFILIGTLEGSGQSERLIAGVPFDFYVVGKQMPAGTYEFIPGKTPGDPNALTVRAVKEKPTTAPVATVEDKIKYGAQPVIVFRQYGDEYFLSAVHHWAANVRLRILRGKPESRLQRANRRPKYVSIRPVRA